MTAMGQIARLPAPRPSVRYRSGKGTFAGTGGLRPQRAVSSRMGLLTRTWPQSSEIGLLAIEYRDHSATWLEMREVLGCHLDRGTRVGIAPHVRRALSCREVSEAAKFNSITSGQCTRNFSKDSYDDSLRLAWGEVRLSLNKLQNELRPNHEDLITRVTALLRARHQFMNKSVLTIAHRNYPWFRCSNRLTRYGKSRERQWNKRNPG